MEYPGQELHSWHRRRPPSPVQFVRSFLVPNSYSKRWKWAGDQKGYPLPKPVSWLRPTFLPLPLGWVWPGLQLCCSSHWLILTAGGPSDAGWRGGPLPDPGMKTCQLLVAALGCPGSAPCECKCVMLLWPRPPPVQPPPPPLLPLARSLPGGRLCLPKRQRLLPQRRELGTRVAAYRENPRERPSTCPPGATTATAPERRIPHSGCPLPPPMRPGHF